MTRQFINPDRQNEKQIMKRFDIKTRKALRKLQKKRRRFEKEMRRQEAVKENKLLHRIGYE